MDELLAIHILLHNLTDHDMPIPSNTVVLKVVRISMSLLDLIYNLVVLYNHCINYVS